MTKSPSQVLRELQIRVARLEGNNLRNASVNPKTRQALIEQIKDDYNKRFNNAEVVIEETGFSRSTGTTYHLVSVSSPGSTIQFYGIVSSGEVDFLTTKPLEAKKAFLSWTQDPDDDDDDF